MTICTNTRCSIVNERYSTTQVNCSYTQHICITCGWVPRVSLMWRHETPPYRGCTAAEKLQWMKFFWLSFQSSGHSNFMYTGIAFCFRTPYNTGFLLIPASTCNHQTYIYSSHLILVSLFSMVDQTLSWTKVIIIIMVTQHCFGDSNLAIIVYSDTSTRVQLGRKYCRCLHNTMSDHTCDFSG